MTRKKIASRKSPMRLAEKIDVFNPPRTIKFKSDGDELELTEHLPKNSKNKWTEDRFVYTYTLSSIKLGRTVPLLESQIKMLIKSDLIIINQQKSQ